MHEVQTLPSFLQQFALLDRHLAQVLAEAREFLRFEGGKQSVAIVRQEYFSCRSEDGGCCVSLLRRGAFFSPHVLRLKAPTDRKTAL